MPEAVGDCDEENLYLTLPTFGLHQYWDLYLGNKLLNRHLALTNGYLAATNSTHLILQIPLFAGGVIYEVQELFSNAFFNAHGTVCSHRVLQSQSVVLWCYTYWKTSRGKDSKPEQVGQEASDMDPSGNAMYYAICSPHLSLKDMHQVFKNKLLSVFSRMRQNVPSALSQKQYFNIAFMKEALLKELFCRNVKTWQAKIDAVINI